MLVPVFAIADCIADLLPSRPNQHLTIDSVGDEAICALAISIDDGLAGSLGL